MPLMSGEDLARRILEIRPDMPIIMCTGFGDGPPRSARALGIREFLMKPVVGRELAAVVLRVLEAARHRHRPAAA